MSNEYEISQKLTLRVLCMYERYVGKNAMDMGELSYDDAVALMYCMYCAYSRMISREAFDAILENESLSERLFTDFAKAMELAKVESKFSGVRDEDNKEEKEDELTATKLVGLLVVNGGLSPEYVLDEMSMWEMQMYVDAVFESVKTRLNEGRLWSFINVSPHIGGDSGMTPHKLLPFPWDDEEEELSYLEKNYDTIKSLLDRYGA